MEEWVERAWRWLRRQPPLGVFLTALCWYVLVRYLMGDTA